MMWRAMVFCLLATIFSAVAMADAVPIRIGITPAIIHDQYLVLMDLRRYLEKKTGRPVELVPRNSYRETIDLMKHDELDFAWVSAYPFVYLRQHFRARLVAAPVLNGRPYFRACLIVPAEDKSTSGLLQLEGKVFAFADPYSYTGYLVPRYELKRAGKDSTSFFVKTFFTWGHKKVIQAVASGLADGGYVDSFVWDSLAILEPALTAQTRIVARSAEYGSPPIVASRKVSEADATMLRRALLEMAADPEGAALLKRLNMDGFVAGDPKAYAEVARSMHAMGDI
jgi:phosphonate transport system substrate-binding protein